MADQSPDRFAQRWMVVVGVFYLLLGLRLLPWVNGAMIEAAGMDTIYRGGDLEPGSTAYLFVLDWMGTFGLDLLVLGGVLLAAARRPGRHRILVHLVIWHEIVAGILDDAWFISRDYVANGFYIGFIGVHLVIIVTAIAVLRRLPSPDRVRAS